MVWQCTLNLISWKIFFKTCCLEYLIGMIHYDGGRSLVIPVGFAPQTNTHPAVKLLTHYIGLYDLNRKWSCCVVLAMCSKNSLNVRCIHNISHLLLIFDEDAKYEKIILSQHGRRLVTLSKPRVQRSSSVSKGASIQSGKHNLWTD